MRKLEVGIWRDSDTVLYLSQEEVADVRSLAPAVDVRAIVPYSFEGPEPIGATERVVPWIVFVAGFGHPPNAEGAAWFVHEVLPSIVNRVPAARLAIVGSNPSPAVVALCGPHVSLFANVTEIELLDWYERAKVAVVPLLAGAGVKLKTVEALWHGVPAVLTPTGAQGLPGVDRVLPVETEPGPFAAAVCDLLTDGALWQRRRAAQIAYAQERFSEAAQRRSLLAALDLANTERVPALEEPDQGCTVHVAMA
jgi:glycosyltransferase involved in cell wall biosynthesis